MEDYTAKEARKINVGLKDVKIPEEILFDAKISLNRFTKPFTENLSQHRAEIFTSTKLLSRIIFQFV